MLILIILLPIITIITILTITLVVRLLRLLPKAQVEVEAGAGEAQDEPLRSRGGGCT